MLKETLNNNQPVKEETKQEKPVKPEGSNWNTSTPPGYREEM